MDLIKILWVDDEIELLKPHLIFLENRGYQTTPCNNGIDALELIASNSFDIVLLDENMPGLSGLETLSEIKNIAAQLPVIMITKNEEEHIMNEAIGTKISDYLIKPVNPNQILLSLKKTLNHKRIIAEKTTQNYQKEFGKIAMELMELRSHKEWMEFFQKLLYWELELESLNDSGMLEIFESQMKEANREFAKFISKKYPDWIKGEDTPLFSHELFKSKVIPELSDQNPTLMVVIDNLRYDQWKTIAPELSNYYKIVQETPYFSILPTATQYARNSLFSGLTPLQMERLHPDLWKNDLDDGGKNMNEEAFLKAQLERLKLPMSFSYHKISKLHQSQKLLKSLQNHCDETLTVVVYNFVDMISHAKTEMELIKELASDDKAYRSLTKSWFKNTSLNQLIQKAAQLGFKLLLTTDHGTINVTSPSEVIGDKSSSINLRYKTGRSLTYDKKAVLSCPNPKDFQLPSLSINSSYIFAKEANYFVYKNNYNHFVNLFRNTFQHGGLSMQEMIIPFVVLRPR